MTNPISFIVKNQLPEFVRGDIDNSYENFVAFVNAYYEWMEQENGVTAESRSLLSYADVDRTSEEFIDYFVNKFLPYFPKDLLSDKAKLIKNINDFYSKKGSVESLKFLFRVLYNEDIQVFLPKENILRASDGKWRIPQALRLTVENTSANFDLSTIKKRLAIGRESRATCVIESAYRTVEVGTNQTVFEVYVSNVRKAFKSGEFLDITYIDENGNKGILLSERIIGALSNMKIVPNRRGKKYRTGDPVVFLGGLSEDPNIFKSEASAVVDEVTDGRIQRTILVDGGYGFRISPETEVDINRSVLDEVDGNTVEAKIEVVEVANTVSFRFNNDSISQYASITIGNTTYGFPNLTSANVNTALARAFSYDTVSLGRITKVKIVSPGTDYYENPDIDVNSYYNTDISENYYNEIFETGNTAALNYTNWESTRQKFLDLGRLANVEIVSGGTGYNTTTDKIYVNRNGGGGYGANITFTVDGFGTIDSVTLVSAGEGYNGPKDTLEVVVRNKNNVYASAAGTGAIIKAFRYGEGEEITPVLADVGSIRTFKFLSRGAGYVSTPNVSLKVKDIVITTLNTQLSPFTEGQIVYQGVVSDPSFIAKVDKYIPTSNTLRVYDYGGTIDLAANLTITATDQFPQYNVNVVSSIIYGDGLAKATVDFSDGLIKYNGYYLNTDGFLSSDKKLQDGNKYHNFSYVVISKQSLQDYRKTLLDVLHPAGTKLFGVKKITMSMGSSFNLAQLEIPLGT
jgi:hypothetical protein